MAFWILLVVVFCGELVSRSAAHDASIKQCEDVLTAEECRKLRDAAEDDGLMESDILNGLQDALMQKEAPEMDTYAKVVEYLDAVFICRIFLSPTMCTQLQGTAASRHVPFHQAEVIMHASRAKGIRQPEQLYAAVMQYLSNFNDEVFHDDVVSLCTAVIPEEMCQKLGEKATKLNLEKSDILKGLTDAKYQGVMDAKKIYEKVGEYLDSVIECVTILDHEHCGAVKLIAMKEKVPFREVERKLKMETSKGVTDKQVLYQTLMSYLKTADDERYEATRSDVGDIRQVSDATTPCSTVLPEKECGDLKTFAQIVSLNEVQVNKAVAEAKMQGATTLIDIVNKAKQFLEDRSYCGFVMEIQMCKDLQTAAETNRVPFHKVRLYMNEYYDRGVKDGKQLYAMTRKYVEETPSVNDETECTADHGGNKCMVLLKSIMQCLSLKIFSWKGGLRPNDVTMSLQEACVASGRKDLYKNAIKRLRCRIYCRIGRQDESCKKIHTCKAKEVKQKNKPKNLVIGIVGNK